MKLTTRIAALLLAVMMLFAGCGADTSKYSSTVAATYGTETTYMDEANFWLRYYQWMYDSYYGYMYLYYYGADFWTVDSGTRTQDNAQHMKETVMAEILQTYILTENAAKYNVDTSLTEAQTAAIETMVAELHDYYAEEFFTLAGNPSDEKMVEWIAKRTVGVKVAEAIKAETEVTITEDQISSFTIRYLLVPVTEEETETEETESEETESEETEAEEAEAETEAAEEEAEETLINEALANKLDAELTEGATLTELSTEYSDLSSGTLSYVRSSTEETSVLFTAGKEMKAGEHQVVADGDTGWYVVVCDSEDDADAAEDVKAELTEEAQTEHFNEVYAELKESAKDFKVKKAFTELTLEYSYVEKTEEETTEEETEAEETTAEETAAEETTAEETTAEETAAEETTAEETAAEETTAEETTAAN